MFEVQGGFSNWRVLFWFQKDSCHRWKCFAGNLIAFYSCGFLFLEVFFSCNWRIVNVQCCVSFKYTALWFSYTYIYVCIFFQILFRYGLLQDIECSSPCHTARTWCSPILYTVECASVLLFQSWLTLRPQGLQPARLLCPWDSPGKNTGVACRALR